MTVYKNSILDFLKLDTDKMITVATDDVGEIYILTKELINFNQQCQSIQEALMVNDYSFEGEKERVVISLTNGKVSSKIILHPNSDDLTETIF